MENLAKKRTHDIFYLDEKPLDNPKKSFEFIINEMKDKQYSTLIHEKKYPFFGVHFNLYFK